MEGVSGQHKRCNKLNNDKEESKRWFAILLLPYAATCGGTVSRDDHWEAITVLIRSLAYALMGANPF